MKYCPLCTRSLLAPLLSSLSLLAMSPPPATKSQTQKMSQSSNPLTEAMSIQILNPKPDPTRPEPQAQTTPARCITDGWRWIPLTQQGFQCLN